MIVYVIIFEAYHSMTNCDEQDRKEQEVFGVFDTERRGICYLRRFIDEQDGDYYDYFGHELTVTERKNGHTSAKAIRCYKNEREFVTETLYMRPMKLNDLKSPIDEIIDIYC